MFEPVSNSAKERLRNSGIIMFKADNADIARTMMAMSEWDTCPYDINYSVRSDGSLPLFRCDITVTKKMVSVRNVRLPKKSDLGNDVPMMIAMAEYSLERLANWAKYLDKKWALVDSCLPYFDAALANAGYSPMKLGTMENDKDHKWHRGRKLLKEE